MYTTETALRPLIVASTEVTSTEFSVNPQHNAPGFKPRPIVFVAHSLGGLVVKEVSLAFRSKPPLPRASQVDTASPATQAVYSLAREDPDNAKCIYGLIFFGVPNQGMQTSQWLPIVSGRPNKNMVQDLEPGSHYLRVLKERFYDSFTSPNSRVLSVYETRMSPTPKVSSDFISFISSSDGTRNTLFLSRLGSQVVTVMTTPCLPFCSVRSPFSDALYKYQQGNDGRWAVNGPSQYLVERHSAIDCWAPGPRHIHMAIDRTHSDLVKFVGPYDTYYLELAGKLRPFWSNAVPDVRCRFGTGIRAAPRSGSSGSLAATALPGMQPSLRDTGPQSPIPLRPVADPAPEAASAGTPVRDTQNDRAQTAFRAIEHVDRVQLQALLDSGLSTETKNSNGLTLLNFAAAHDRLDICELLVARGASIDSTCDDGDTPLCRAVIGGFLTLSKFFLQHGASATSRTPDGHSLLQLAATGSGDVETLRLLVIMGADIKEKTADGQTLLHLAAVGNNSVIIAALVNWGITIDKKSANGSTALHEACLNGNVEAAEALIDAGANIERTRTGQGSKTPLACAVNRGRAAVVEMLIRRGACLKATGRQPYPYGAAWMLLDRGSTIDSRTTKALAAGGVDFNAHNDEGISPLHHAVEGNNLGAVREYLDNGADIENVTSPEQGTPLHFAALEGHLDVARLLLESQAKRSRA